MDGEDVSKKNGENNDTISHLKNFLASSKVLKPISPENDGQDDYDNNDNSESLKNERSSDSFGIHELKLVVKEYENLKEKYESLQKEVEAKMKNKENEVVKYENEIEKLQKENKRLNQEMEALMSNSESFHTAKEEMTSAFQKTIDRLDLELKQQKVLTHEANERLTAHDTAAKRAIAVLQKEMGTKVEQVTKLYQDTLSEKDEQIIRVSKLESLIDELQQLKQTQNKKILEHQTELESVKSLLKSKTSDLSKIATSNESHEKEVSKLNKKIETLQEEVKNQEIKVKWAQNKLKAELDAHKETKKQIAQLNGKLQQAKEEGDMIRKDCQQMIERYQGDEEIQSVRLNKELEENIAKLKTQEEDLAKQEEINKERLQAIEIVNRENGRLSGELSEQKCLVMTLGEKNKQLAHQLGEQEKDFADMKSSLEQTKDQVKEFDENIFKIKEYETEIKTLKESELQLKQSLQDAELEVSEQAEKHQEILQFSANLTENNVFTKAAAADLQSQFEALLAEKGDLIDQLNKSKEENKRKVELLAEEKQNLEKELSETKSKADDHSNKVKELTLSFEDAQEELRVLKKKNAQQVKDLQRQLHQTTRKIEKMESISIGSTENLSIRSRTSSCNSIEKIHQSESPPHSSSPQLHHEPVVMINQDHYINQPSKLQQQQQQQQNSFGEVEIDQKVLIERICKLQRTLAKRNEKLEFMEEHINQLTEEVQKKAKIIQFYVLKEEAGSIAPDRYDRVKAEAIQHGGIMASVYSARATDKHMTLELSLDINKKLQAVLEDMILKNITLKESINTLGGEIAKLQVELQEAKKT